MSFKYVNFINTELLAGVGESATELRIPATEAVRLGPLGAGEVFRMTLHDGRQIPELVDVTANPQTGILTVTRGVESSTAKTWAQGTSINITLTAAQMQAVADAEADAIAAAASAAAALASEVDAEAAQVAAEAARDAALAVEAAVGNCVTATAARDAALAAQAAAETAQSGAETAETNAQASETTITNALAEYNFAALNDFDYVVQQFPLVLAAEDRTQLYQQGAATEAGFSSYYAERSEQAMCVAMNADAGASAAAITTINARNTLLFPMLAMASTFIDLHRMVAKLANELDCQKSICYRPGTGSGGCCSHTTGTGQIVFDCVSDPGEVTTEELANQLACLVERTNQLISAGISE